MNPLSVSVAFVVCSIMLSFLKNIFFPSSSSSNSIIKFNRVFHLTDNKVEKGSKSYKSLYQAYHKSQAYDAHKFTNMLPNRSYFNQSVLSNSMRNAEDSFMCGSDYLILVLSGTARGETQMLNIINIYKLPLIIKIDQIKISSKLLIPRQCKKKYTNPQNENEQQLGYYKFIAISKLETLQIKISHSQRNGQKINDMVQIKRLKQNFDNNKYLQIQAIDFDEGWIAYCIEQKPWLIYIEHYMHLNDKDNIKDYKHFQPIELAETNQINLLNFQKNSAEPSEGIYQQIRIRNILIKTNPNNSNSLYLIAIYDYHKLGSIIKHIVLSVFQIDSFHMNLLSRTLIDSDDISLDDVKTQCIRYFNEKTQKFDISCLVVRDHELYVKFVNLANIYERNKYHYKNKEHKQPQKQVNSQQEQSSQTQQNHVQQQSQESTEQSQHKSASLNQSQTDQNWILSEINQLFSVEDEYVDDLLWMVEELTPLAEVKYFQQNNLSYLPLEKLKFLFKVNSVSKIKLIKASIPDPIIYYINKGQSTLYSFFLPDQVEQQIDSQQYVEISSIIFNLDPPLSQKKQEQMIRDIKWIQQEKLVIVVWGGGIEAFQYSCINLQDGDSQGIAMTVILPFIQLFATVFCLLRMVWNTQ